MKGQVRGLALELLRQDCVESLDKANSITEGKKRKEELRKAAEIENSLIQANGKLNR